MKTHISFSPIELLESRIAPATLTGRVLKYVDLDGDQVTVTFTKGSIASSNFTFDTSFATTGPQQLQRIDVSGVADVEGSNLIVSTKRATGGDGIAHIGEIIATGRDLGVVKTGGNIGKIIAGNNTLPAPGIKALTIGSYGIFDGATQPMASNQSSIITGSVGSITILGDFGVGTLSVAGSVKTLKVGGSFVGGSNPSEGRFIISGDLTTGTIGGSFIGGAGTLSAQLTITGNAGSLLIRGSLIIGAIPSDVQSGQVEVSGSIKTLNILGDVRGSSTTFTQNSISVDGTVGSLKIGGSVSGRPDNPATIRLADTITLPGIAVTSVLIKGTAQNMILSAGLNFGTGSTLSVGSVTINGSFLQSRIAIGAQYGADNKPGTADDMLNAASVLNKLIIKGAVFGTVGGSDYFGILAGKIASATLSGSKIALAPGAQNLNVALSSDVFVKDAA